MLAVSAALDLSRHEKTLDPPPLQKWAEEGYAVAQILIDERAAANLVQLFGIALAELEKLPECSNDKFGLVGMRLFIVKPPRCPILLTGDRKKPSDPR